jgi:Uma2 family endonuclease
MSAAEKLDTLSVEDYLAGELVSPIRHEYLGGTVYAMAAARIAHIRISGNALITLGAKLRGKPCQPYNPDMKIRVQLARETRFYYPDLSVIYRSNPQDALYQDEPVVLLEVLSRATRRVDEGEKREAYQSIPSLSVYLLAEQESAAVVAYRRNPDGGFAREVHVGLDAVIPLPEIGCELSLADLYDGVVFVAEVE